MENFDKYPEDSLIPPPPNQRSEEVYCALFWLVCLFSSVIRKKKASVEKTFLLKPSERDMKKHC